MKNTICHIHGEQGIGLVCKHIAHAVIADKGRVFSGAMKLTPLGLMPGALSAKCHCARSMVRHPSNGSEMRNLRLSVLRADEAKAVCGGFRH